MITPCINYSNDHSFLAEHEFVDDADGTTISFSHTRLTNVDLLRRSGVAASATAPCNMEAMCLHYGVVNVFAD